jgi:hypothetical protein
MTKQLAAGNSDRTCQDIELAFTRVVELSPFLKLGRGSDTSLSYPAQSTDPPSDMAPAASVIHARYPSAYNSALHLQLEAWDDGSYRLTCLAAEGTARSRDAQSMARRLAQHFERLITGPTPPRAIHGRVT